MKQKQRSFLLIFCLIVSTIFTGVVIAQKKRPKSKRAKRPDFSKDDGSIFFENVFKQALKGKRPAALNKKATVIAAAGAGSSSSGAATNSSSGDSYAWSKIISADAIEIEVKAIKAELDKIVTTPGKFRSGGYKNTRIQMSILASLFAIISEYDGDVRWKKVATNARVSFAKCAANCAVGTQQSYSQAKNRKTDLQDILNGSSVTFTEKGEGKVKWNKIVDRTPLMQRLEISYMEKIKPWTASKSEFTKNKDQLEVEANLVAAMSEILAQEEMEDGEEEDYVAYAEKMKKGALAIIAAIKDKDVDAASKGAGEIDKACANCHDDWK